MLLNDALGHPQAEARSGFALGTEEGLEELPLDLGRHTRATVLDGNQDPRPPGGGWV